MSEKPSPDLQIYIYICIYKVPTGFITLPYMEIMVVLDPTSALTSDKTPGHLGVQPVQDMDVPDVPDAPGFASPGKPRQVLGGNVSSNPVFLKHKKINKCLKKKGDGYHKKMHCSERSYLYLFQNIIMGIHIQKTLECRDKNKRLI